MTSNIKSLRKEEKHPHSLVFSADGTPIFLREWAPDESSNIAILLFHGMTAHSRPYEEIGVNLSKLGYNVYGMDLRGHGLSGGDRGDLPSKKALREDLDTVLEFLEGLHSEIIILGHSMGVITSLITASDFPEVINGIILLSGRIKPPVSLLPDLGFLDRLKIMVNGVLFPSKATIEIEGIEEIIETDELFNFRYTPRFFDNMDIGTLQLPENIEQPIFVAVGDEDELFEVDDIREFYQLLPPRNKEFAVIKGGKHVALPSDWIATSGLEAWLAEKFTS